MNGRRAEALEALVRPGVVRIIDPAGETRGTGFVVARRVFTCAHVVENVSLGELAVEAGGGGIVAVRSLVVNLDLDVAMLEIGIELPSLAIGSFERPAEVLSIGFPDVEGVTGPIVMWDEISGNTAIRYGESGATFALPDVWSLPNGLVAPGSSGAPLIDAASGAVVGMIVAGLDSSSGRSGLAGFVQPLANLVDDPAFRAVLAEARTDIPRFGPAPNDLASRSWTQLATSAILTMMEAEGRYDRSKSIPRKALDQALKSFLEGDAPIWAVVDQSGVGKTTGLARAAEHQTDRPSLFLRAMEIDDASKMLDTLAQDALMSVAPSHIAQAPTLAALADAARAPPLIIVDGINEARISTADLRDRWLPGAVRAAGGCKLVVTCRPEMWEEIAERLPEHLFHAGGRTALARKRRPTFEVGEFTDQELAEFSRKRGRSLPRWLKKLRNPLLLTMAGELQSHGDRDKIERWALIAAYVRRHCSHAGDRIGVSRRRAETLIEHLAFACLERPNPIISKSDPMTLDPAFQGLLDENLLVDERDGYGFRYDVLYEHLAARGIRTDDLAVVDNRWEHAGRPVPWTVIRAYCDRLKGDCSPGEIDRFLDRLRGLDDPKQADNLLSCLAALPLGDGHRDIVQRALLWVGQQGSLSFLLIEREIAEAEWSDALMFDALRVQVIASSGYDFRANDLSAPDRIARARGQFELQGFERHIRMLMARDRKRLLSTLREWHDDMERLGIIHRDISKESTVSSWVSCCLIFCAALLTREELIDAMSPESSASVFEGLSLIEPIMLAEIANILASRPELPSQLFRHALRALHAMEELQSLILGYSPQIFACRLGLGRFDDLASIDFKNTVICWCASAGPELAEQGWLRLKSLANAGEAESLALQAYLPKRPDEVINLARRKPEAFATQSGFLMLDLAKPPHFDEPVRPDSPELKERMKLLQEHIAEHGADKAACGVMEDLLYAPDAKRYAELGLMNLALTAVEQGPEARVLMYVAGDWNAIATGDSLLRANMLAEAIVARCPDREMVLHVVWKRAVRALKPRARRSEIQFVLSLARRAVSRFGPELLLHALRNMHIFMFQDEADRKTDLLDALAELSEDPRVATEIAKLRAI